MNFTAGPGNHLSKKPRLLTFDLHPLYGSILKDGQEVREGDVLGLDRALRHIMIAPFSGIIQLLSTGDASNRHVRVFLSEKRP